MVMNFVIDEIITIEDIECDSLRYDIGVEDNNNFFANDILVHNCQNLRNKIKQYADNQLTFEVTEKLDGSSMTVYFNNGEFGVCSRNLDLKFDENNSFWKAVIKNNLQEKMTGLGRNFAIQGELIGNGIQGNMYNINHQDFFVFDMFDIDGQNYFSPEARSLMCELLELNHVPILDIEFKIVSTEVDDLLYLAEGKSLLNEKAEREGLVFKCNEDPSISFKAISNKFLLKEKG